MRVFKIPLISLVGQMTERAVQGSGNRPRSFISPLVNIAESPVTGMLQRSDSPLGVMYGLESGTVIEESRDSSTTAFTGNVQNIGLHPHSDNTFQWSSKSPIIPRPSAEYSDSGYSESDFSFESVDGSVPHSSNVPLRGVGPESAETRRKMFGCLRSPRLQRRTFSSHAENEARAELFGHHTSANRFGRPLSPRPRYGSNHSDSVFYSGTRTDSRSSSVQSENADSKFDLFNISQTRSVSQSSQSEADMRAELLGKLLRSPRLGHVVSAPVLNYENRSDSSGSVFEPIQLPESPSPTHINHVPFQLSSSVDDDEIDLK